MHHYSFVFFTLPVIDGLTPWIQISIVNHWLFQWFGKNFTQQSPNIDIAKKRNQVCSLNSWIPDFYFGYTRVPYLVWITSEFQNLIPTLHTRIWDAKSSNWHQFDCQFKFWDNDCQKRKIRTKSTFSSGSFWSSPSQGAFSVAGVGSQLFLLPQKFPQPENSDPIPQQKRKRWRCITFVMKCSIIFFELITMTSANTGRSFQKGAQSPHK